MKLFVGGQGAKIQGEPFELGGLRMLTPVHNCSCILPGDATIMLDSGAFSDRIDRRLTVQGALERQLEFECTMQKKFERPDLRADYIVSYDVLIDEVWVGGKRHKARWSRDEAEFAVKQTIDAAEYLAGQRSLLGARSLVLSAQGVDAEQYVRCAHGVLEYAWPRDTFGMGGWCIIGRYRSWLPEFKETARRVVPLVAHAGLRHIHIFGVLWQPALAYLLYLCDQYGISLSTDSTRPIRDMFGDAKKAGRRCDYWRDNVAWWRSEIEGLRASDEYAALGRAT